MKILYTTSATSVGGRDGHVKNADGQINLNLKSPGSKDNRQGTTPEDLFAAGYAGCFNGALNRAIRLKQVKPTGDVEVRIEISLGTDEEERFCLAARIEGRIPGVDPALGRELMQDAHTICPYSRATRGNIDVELALA